MPANGKSETIAVIDVDHDPYILPDLARFDATYGLTTPVQLGQNAAGTPWINVLNLAGNTTDDGWGRRRRRWTSSRPTRCSAGGEHPPPW